MSKVELWKRKDDCTEPVRVAADAPGEYPGCDDDGDAIYENTHFATQKEAWDCVLSNLRAWVYLSAARVDDLRKQVTKREQECATAAIALTDAEKKFQSWKDLNPA